VIIGVIVENTMRVCVDTTKVVDQLKTRVESTVIDTLRQDFQEGMEDVGGELNFDQFIEVRAFKFQEEMEDVGGELNFDQFIEVRAFKFQEEMDDVGGELNFDQFIEVREFIEVKNANCTRISINHMPRINHTIRTRLYQKITSKVYFNSFATDMSL
jgi:hypothetical protein